MGGGGAKERRYGKDRRTICWEQRKLGVKIEKKILKGYGQF